MKNSSEEKGMKSLNFLLKDIVPDDHYHEPWEDSGNGTRSLKRYDVELPEDLKVKHPFIIYLLFVEIKQYPILSLFEKVKWEIPIRFKNRSFVLAHRKFGFTISTYVEREDDKQLAAEVITLIHKATPLTEGFVQELLGKKISAGKITIENDFLNIMGRYFFFRTKTSGEIKASTKSKAGFYYMLSMIDAYFSLLEHLLVLLLPFMKHVDMKSTDLENFIGSNWKGKFNIVLDTKNNNTALKHLVKLNEIKEQIRNPASHGNFLKKGSSFNVHMDNLGAIPFTLTRSKTDINYSFDDNSEIAFKNIIDEFNSFDSYLKTDPRTVYAMQYVLRGLPVFYDKKSVSTYRKRMVSQQSTERYINETVRDIENHMNMDW
ncbi:hypothetical protein D3C85_123760 [compost metagenome]